MSREVFRPPSERRLGARRVSAQAAARRVRRRQARRRGCLRPPPQDAPELARARRPCHPRQRAGSARGAGRARSHARRGARAGRLRRARAAAAMTARSPTRRSISRSSSARSARRQARAHDRLPAGRARRPDRARAGGRTRRRGLRGRHARPRRARGARRGSGGRAGVARPDREGDPRRRRPRRRQLRRRNRARARERDARPAAAGTIGCTTSPLALGADVPFFLADGPSARRGRRHAARAARAPAGLHRRCSSLPDGAAKESTASVYARVRRADGAARLRGAPRCPARRARRPATSPRCRRTTSRRSPLAAQLEQLGALPRRRQRRRPGGLRPLRGRGGCGRSRPRCRPPSAGPGSGTRRGRLRA